MRLALSVQTKDAVDTANPGPGFEMLKRAGFDFVDFSLNAYMKNSDIYKGKISDFFSRDIEELKNYFAPMREAAKKAGIGFGQMHMPYPCYVAGIPEEVNDFLREEMAVKSLQLGAFMHCPYIVIHGFKLKSVYGSEEREWEKTREFLDYLAGIAGDSGMVMCLENLYSGSPGGLVEGPCTNAHILAERIDAFNEKYGKELLGACFDTGHAKLVGLDVEEFLTRLGKRLKVLHIHDNDGISDLHQLPFTFTRTRDNLTSTAWRGFARGLAAAGFDGNLSFETAPVLSSFPGEMKEDALSFIGCIGRYFRQEILKEREGLREREGHSESQAAEGTEISLKKQLKNTSGNDLENSPSLPKYMLLPENKVRMTPELSELKIPMADGRVMTIPAPDK